MSDLLTIFSTVVTTAQKLREVSEKIKDADAKNLVADLNMSLADLKMKVAELQEENLDFRNQLAKRCQNGATLLTHRITRTTPQISQPPSDEWCPWWPFGKNARPARPETKKTPVPSNLSIGCPQSRAVTTAHGNNTVDRWFEFEFPVGVADSDPVPVAVN